MRAALTSFVSAVIGILKGFDQLQNLVLDQVKEEATGEIDIFLVSLP